jgi:5-methylthioribose kinase
LLTGQVEREIALVCGAWLGRLHAATWRDDELARGFVDQRVFDELRLDPYYRQLGRRFPDWRPQLDALVAETLRHRLALVHADFSPKNLLVWPQGLLLVDYETGHFGDPAFDLGFFLTHLALKAAWAGPRRADYLALADAFWQTYAGTVAPALPEGDFAELSRRAALHFAGCLWARLDGKSPVDYLGDPPARPGLRSLSQGLLARPPRDWPGARERMEAALSDLASNEPAPSSSACAEWAP